MAVFYNREKGKHGSLTGTIINFPKRVVSEDPASTINKKLIPPGYLTCDGRILLATDYPMLATVLGTGTACKFKKEDQALADDQFQLPDLRCKHVRATSAANVGQYVDLVVTNKNVTPERDVIKSGVGLDVIQNIPSPYELTYDGSFYIPPQELPLVGEPRFSVDSGNYTYYAEVSDKMYQPHMHRSNTFRARQYDFNGNHFSGRQRNSDISKSSLNVCQWWSVAKQMACYWYWTGQAVTDSPGRNPGSANNYWDSYGACYSGICDSFKSNSHCLWPDSATCPTMTQENQIVNIIASSNCNHTNRETAVGTGDHSNIFGEITTPGLQDPVTYDPTYTASCYCKNVFGVACIGGVNGPSTGKPNSDLATTDLKGEKGVPFAPYDESYGVGSGSVTNKTMDTGMTGDDNSHRHILELDTDEEHTYVLKTRATSARADSGLLSRITISKNNDPKADKYIQPYIVQEYLIKT